MASNRILKITSQGEVRFYEALAGGLNYVALKAAAALAGTVTWTLPAADGTNGQLLSTNGAGVLSFQSGTATLQTAYNSGQSITLSATPVSLSQANNASALTVTKSGTGTGNTVQIDDDGTGSGLRINKTGAAAAFQIVQTGGSTAMTISQATANACISLTANGNSAALQINQVNLLDSITTNGDIRCQQAISTLNTVLYNDAGLQWGESGHGPSGPFYDALTLTVGGTLQLGNTARDWPLTIQTGAASAISFVTNSATRLSISSLGVISSTQASNNGMLSLNKSATGAGIVLDLTNAGTGIGLNISQTGAEDAVRIAQSAAGTPLRVSNSHNTSRVCSLTKTGTGGNPALDIANAGTGQGCLITQTGDAVGLQISPSSASVNAAIGITHGGTGLVRDIEGTSQNWYITSRGNAVFQRDASTRSLRTISSGAITIAKGGWIFLTGEGGLADDLDTIASDSNDPVVDGQRIYLKAADDAVTITVTEAGNIELDGGSKVLDSSRDVLALIYESSLAKWLQFGFASNA